MIQRCPGIGCPVSAYPDPLPFLIVAALLLVASIVLIRATNR